MTESNSKVIASAMQSKKPHIKWNTELFIAKAKEIHGHIYNYSQVKYLNMWGKVLIICPIHGDFLQTPHQHFKGSGCRACGIRRTKLKTCCHFESFKHEAGKRHGNFYSYGKAIWNDERGLGQKVQITCPIHGDFEQLAANHIIGRGCPKCKGEKTRKAKIKSREDFIASAIETHGDLYDYSFVEYFGNKVKVNIVCAKHGEFLQSPTSHLNGSGCFKCFGKRRLALSIVLDRFKKTHGNKYDYSLVKYRGWQSKIKIVCKEHGVFEQAAGSHASGSGCGECAANETHGWSKSDYVRMCELRHDGNTNLYLIKCTSDQEEFYKIGITVDSVKKRFSGKGMPYNYKTLKYIGGEAAFIWELERRLHEMLSEYHYLPQTPFGGSVKECFSRVPREVIRFLDDLGESNQLPLIA